MGPKGPCLPLLSWIHCDLRRKSTSTHILEPLPETQVLGESEWVTLEPVSTGLGPHPSRHRSWAQDSTPPTIHHVPLQYLSQKHFQTCEEPGMGFLQGCARKDGPD